MTIRKFVYTATKCVETTQTSLADCLPASLNHHFTWIDIDGKITSADLQPLVDNLKLHPLVIEDIETKSQRPKVVHFDNYIYVLMVMLEPPTGGERNFSSEHVGMLLGKNYVISFQQGRPGDVLESVRQELRTGKGLVRTQGSDYLLYELVNVMVDHYFTVLESIDEKVEYLEDAIVKGAQTKTVQSLHALKRDLAYLRKSVWPTREVVGNLERGTSPFIHANTAVYLRDVYDHTIQIIDTIETLRDILSGLIDVYLSTVSNRMNAVIKVLTIITTIFMPLTLLAGIFGMNFSYLPGLSSPWGPIVTVAGMVVITASMLLLFRAKRWIS